MTENDLTCPITQKVASKEPVSVIFEDSSNNEKSKHIFSRCSIEEWMKGNKTDPVNGWRIKIERENAKYVLQKSGILVTSSNKKKK